MDQNASQRTVSPSSDERQQVIRSTAVAAVDETGSVAVVDAMNAERVAVLGMEDRLGLQDEWPDLPGAGDELRPREVTQEVGLPAEGVVAPAQLVGDVQADASRLVELVLQVMAQRDEIDVVIGVHVADDHGSDGRRFAISEQRTQGTLAQVQHQRLSAELDEVGRGRSTRALGPRGRGAEDREPHALARSEWLLLLMFWCSRPVWVSTTPSGKPTVRRRSRQRAWRRPRPPR